ncbi:M23 family metallopeptidase [Paenalkalicoccus suaedae]|uniref:M23 family metallopeptidase n=1 Tax=Paenalkalicoccus suaedae TaxID=2592382 RepID=A0A859FHP5_9BACI|nr:M23 family metallopeptidase [Paenalkalicoccus suaedae]QKS72194.1 M23 family metallopeptidase [Paenalkalicoccus suaedae]
MRLICFIILLFALFPQSAFASDDPATLESERMALYEKAEITSQIPWYYFAAADSYERGIRKARKLTENGKLAFIVSEEEWVGSTNPVKNDTSVASIDYYGGIGQDGDGDEQASLLNDEDVIQAIATQFSKRGTSEDHIKAALWDYYRRDHAVTLISNHAKVYKELQTTYLPERSFPLPLHANYSYRSTWGDARGWGGRRIHEGTDIFAGYGVPVKATTYGVVELKGWNKYGGWRIGLRDTKNVYHYFAHLSGFEKGIEEGSVVKPGDVIGYVGSSGYGKPGTQGKFPPHLHYGMYQHVGYTEWSFDPYPSLRIWERQDRAKKKSS